MKDVYMKTTDNINVKHKYHLSFLLIHKTLIIHSMMLLQYGILGSF